MRNTYCDVIEFFGAGAQKVKALEELSELQVELVRDLNSRCYEHGGTDLHYLRH